ncbi:ThuA domain-containing protein [Saccharicrinis sp. GN24d3]|uniref:ThuA domain-containing protein n=1 Tax=Saccharicrinis sp. GN24d3 TaxID=3458416 RepID=UPI004035ECA4
MNWRYIRSFFAMVFFVFITQNVHAQTKIRVLNFQADNGFQHKSKQAGLEMIEHLGEINNWEVHTSIDTSDISMKKLSSFDVIVFNNNCGNKGRIFSDAQHRVLQNYIRSGGGFVGIHCAGAIWKEGGEFQLWYEKLVGTSLVKHPKVQPAKLIVENKEHICTCHLPDEWMVTDEWHTFSHNPRNNVNVLISLDESSYEDSPKMGGDHPFTWYQYYDGGRSFFTSLGHTIDIYADENYQKLVQGGIIWASGMADKQLKLPVAEGLMLDLDADYGISLEKGNRISSWKNQVGETVVKSFDKQDKGRIEAGSGMPRLKLNVPELNGHNSVVFHRQEMVNEHEDAFDHLTTGSGYTWFAVISVYEQVQGKPGVNAFFGNLRNTNVDKKGQYEGLWAGLSDENQMWTGARNALQKGLWNENSPHVLYDQPLEASRYYLVMGRMGSGTDKVPIELFINSNEPVASEVFPVNTKANPSKMVIGQERDATNHPGVESFDGEIARFLIFDHPLSDDEIINVMKYLEKKYNIQL